MGIRTGKQFLEGLRDDREIWIDGERVKDVTTDPRFAGAAQTLAELFDLQHEPALKDKMTYASPTTGDRSGVKLSGPQKSFLIPVSNVTGTRDMARSTNGPMRSQSGAISPKEKSSGTPSTFQGAQIGSKRPIMSPLPSSR